MTRASRAKQLGQHRGEHRAAGQHPERGDEPATEEHHGDDGDAELGFFSPCSWWPLVLAFAIGLSFLGLAVGFWLTFCAVGLVLVALVGWVYEYYRGNFAR